MISSSNGTFPFTSNASAGISYQCAFNIADAYSKLPIPQPINNQQTPLYNFNRKLVAVPRMIPIFSCCAMQSSYALIMLYHRTKNMGLTPDSIDGGTLTHAKIIMQLKRGLNVLLETLRNYSLAYEALGGMRGKSALNNPGFFSD
jgi:hypothetical protein